MAMSEENKQKARERMQAMHAAKKGKPVESIAKPVDSEVEALKARIAELEAQKTPTVEAPKEGKSRDEQIVDAYQSSRNSIQDIARIFNVSVDHVLNLTGNASLASITFQGDMVDAQEAGPGAVLSYGQEVKIPYTTN